MRALTALDLYLTHRPALVDYAASASRRRIQACAACLRTNDCPGKTELHPGIVEISRVIVEYEPQSRIEGEIQQMPADSPVTEFWRLVNGEISGRENARDVTLFDSVGFALEDYSALRYVLEMARQFDIGSTIELVPKLTDPKDLFARLIPEAMVSQKKRA